MPSFSLEVRSTSSGEASQFPLVGDSLVVGRARESQIFLDSRTISRRHAEFHMDPFGRWWIRDLGSHNGTMVNGHRISEHMLKPGDVAQLGEFLLTLSASGELPALEPATMGMGADARIGITDADAGRISSLRDFDVPRLSATHLSILSEFGQQLLTLLSPAERMTAMCSLMVRKEFHGRSAMVLRASKESFTEPPKPLCAPQSAPGDKNLSPYISRTLLRTMLARNEAVLASNSASRGPGGGAAPAEAADVAELSLASEVMSISAVACPLRSEQQYTDLLYVLFPPEYGTPEWLALSSLVVKQYQQAESTWAARKLGEDHAAIERELSRAHSIQKRLVPRDVAVAGLDYAIGFTPCRWVGGDYVDVVKGSNGKILLTIADVCGKGLPAALVASSLHMLTHTAMRANTPLPAIMQNLNVYLSESLSEGTFVTMLSALLTIETGELEIINAGHPAGLVVVPPSGDITLTQNSTNLPLGLDPGAELVGETTTLPANAYLILFTDGLSELPIANGELLGEEALASHIAGIVKNVPAAVQSDGPAAVPVSPLAAPSSSDISTRLTTLLDSLQEGMSRDDRTFLVARRV
jgi:hypothetical protein